ncbi:MAG TPA: S8 family serine peptidase [Candidatus Limnocylindrales bacterium]|nr:S8 family serine peptidase [Candidatus Limnocylindrales bacterium]
MSRPVALAALLLALLVVAPTGALASEVAAPADPYIVVVAEGAAVAKAGNGAAAAPAPGGARVLEHVAARNTVAIERRFDHLLNGFAANLTPGQVQALAADPDVAAVVPDERIELTAQSMPTGVARVGGRTSPTAKINGIDERVDADVAIVDTGIDGAHPDLNVAGGVNCSTADRGAWQDDNGHGTHVAGTVAAKDNGIGVVGVAPGARLWAVRILDASGGGFLSWYICGLDWIAAQRDPGDATRPLIEAVNMSVAKWGADDGNCGATNNDVLHAAICRLVSSGVTVVAAAANDSGPASKRVPAAYDEVITVSALADTDGRPGGLGGNRCYSWGTYDVDDTFADFSNYGPDVDLIAPGKCIWSTKRGNTYGWSSGTSMAAPHVTGAVALYRASRPYLSPAEVKRALLYLGSTNWFTGTDPDSTHERLLDVSRIGPFGTVTMTPSPAAVVATESGGTFPISLTLARPGVLEELTLSVTGAPAGLSAALDRTAMFGFEATSAKLTVSVPRGYPSGTYPLTVQATWKHGTLATARVNVVVESDLPTAFAPGFNIRAGEMLGTSAVPFIMSWKPATDPSSAIAGYQMAERIDGGTLRSVAYTAAGTTSLRRAITPGHIYTWSVRARDGAGNWSPWAETRNFRVVNVPERSSAVKYAGTWSTTYTSVAYGGTRRTTTTRGATATFTVWGTSAVIVGTMGPTRSNGEVWVDGKKVATFSGYSPTTKNRAILAYVQLGAAATHTVVVKNLGTSGRARLDVDGMILIR